ncbi:MAG: T9SS type A sorting domain-containing protein, partial [Bacteroidales bacterium]|nr:T9SS type A sorting domain-containing protein [Bacteroidales bacterium]
SQTVNGCDSVVAMTLTVNPIYQVTDTKTICESELPYTWNNVVFNAAGTQNVTLRTVNGCDSVVAMTLIVNPTYNVSDIKNVCPSEMPYIWNGITFNAPGTHTVTLATVNGCDSVVTMILSVNQTPITHENRTICESELPYEWNGIVFNTFGANTAILQGENGCDSTVIMTLNVIPSYRITDTRTICQSELPYTWNDVVFNATDTQSVTLQASNGCDSVVTMILVVNPTYNIIETKSVCPSEMPYVWNGVTFSNAGVQVVTLTTANGCDSVVTMMLTVNQTHVTNESRTICQNELPYEWNGVTFDAAGVNTTTLPDANGCDSTVIMTLHVNPAYNINESMTICESELPYTWNGVVFDAAGTQSLNLETVNGCDSIITMTLTVNPTYTVSDAHTICESELPYTWNGVVFDAAGTQNVTLPTVNGCDSVVTMTLTVNMPVSTDLQVTACESYEWNEDTYTESGDYTQTYTAANGCDSVVTLHLTINNSVSTEFSIETSENCYTWNEQTYCQSGDYVQTFSAANGCDSVVTLHLTISVGINSHNLNISMTVYPNPTSDVINVEFGMDNEQWQPDVLQLFDASGKIVNSVKLSNTYNGSTRTTQIDLSNLSNGIYFLKATKEGQTMAIRKIVKN